MKAWAEHTKQQRTYSRRKPEATPLYRIVSSGHEELAECWDVQFEHEYGALREEVPKAFAAYLSCGIIVHGCARAQCENTECRHSELIAFSCKRRSICPSCDAKRALLFAENLVENVLEAAPHQHCVFTVPKRIRPCLKFDRSLMQNLYSAAWESWKELAREQCPTGTPAAVLELHTAGDLLAWHPHVHGLYLSGVTQPDGTFHPITIDQARLQALFADKVLAALRDAELLTQDDIDNMKSWPHPGFNVFIGEPIAASDQQRLLLVARYLKKCPLSNERLTIVEHQLRESSIEYAAYKHGVKSVRVFTVLGFLAEVALHVPDLWEQTTRFFGGYAARSRGAAAARRVSSSDADANTITPLPEAEQRPTATWARLIKKVFELDPLLCPRCGAAMKIKAFITDPKEIARIMSNRGLPQQRAPPPLKFQLPIAA